MKRGYEMVRFIRRGETFPDDANLGPCDAFAEPLGQRMFDSRLLSELTFLRLTETIEQGVVRAQPMMHSTETNDFVGGSLGVSAAACFVTRAADKRPELESES